MVLQRGLHNYKGLQMRRDAEANREKLIAAGKQLMQDEGGDVPVERICQLAKVTRGTFYRHFTDRAALYEAVLEHELHAMVIVLAAPAADPLHFLRLFAEMMMLYDKYLAALPDMADYRDDGVSEAKIVGVIESPLQAAKAAGQIGNDITADDVMLVCRMVACDWRLDRVDGWQTALDRRLSLIMRGIAP
ncbi:TetR family transcriptional regulator [Sphingomonas sp. PP-CE-1G-424]|jgi:AcrR family transcriptional regulator|nr:TetR family transcriptional regulator [Sphingomonas sp. PP-CE-1G-424]